MREKIKLESTAGTGHFYTTTKNKRTTPDKMEIKKYDPGRASTLSTRKQRSNNARRSTRDRKKPALAGFFSLAARLRGVSQPPRL